MTPVGYDQRPRRRTRLRVLGQTLAAVAVAAGLLSALWLVVVTLPLYFAPPSAFPSRAEAIGAQNAVRTTLLQGAGALLVLGTAVAGAWLTSRQLRLNRQGQLTERLTHALEQLNAADLHIRLTAIYALERIARETPSDRATIGEILATYLRGRSPWPPSRPGQYVADADVRTMPALIQRAPDLQAILEVFGRGGFTRGMNLDLTGLDLRKAALFHADLPGVWLAYAHLEYADLRYARLAKADLDHAHLHQAFLGAARLDGADLESADLSRADLRYTSLQGADLRDARLDDVQMLSVNLKRARLPRRLNGVWASGAMTWPAGFDWRAAGVRRFDDPTDRQQAGLPGGGWRSNILMHVDPPSPPTLLRLLAFVSRSVRSLRRRPDVDRSPAELAMEHHLAALADPAGSFDSGEADRAADREVDAKSHQPDEMEEL